MKGILKMPRVGETMEEGRLTAWLVEPGQLFKRGDPVLEVETDKTLVEYPALGDGILLKSLVDIGDMVDVGTPIAEIEMSDGPNWLGADSAEDAKKTNEPDPDSLVAEPAVDVKTEGQGDNTRPDPSNGQRLRATPLARRVARQGNVDLGSIAGTGRRGRVVRADVESALTTGNTSIHTEFGIAWCEKGKAGGTPVLFVHGYAADHTAWTGLQSQMSRSGYQTFAVDLPSHGTSSHNAVSVSELAPPVIEFARQTISAQPLHIVAHSMGALVAVELAQSVAVASLTLIAPAGVGITINSNFLSSLANPRDVASITHTLDSLTHGPNGLSHSANEAIFNTLCKRRITDIAHSLAGASGQSVDIRQALAKLAAQVPVSVLLGHRDQVINWSEALDVSPLIAVHHFPHSGHMPHWEEQAAVQCILERQIGK